MCRPGAGLFGSIVNYGSAQGGRLGGNLGSVGSRVGSFLGGGGVAGYAFCHVGGNCKKPPTRASVAAYSYILADSIRRATLNCQSAVDTLQRTRVENTISNAPVESEGCDECARIWSLLFTHRRAFAREARLPPISRVDLGDPCRFACRSNVVESVSQRASFVLSATCSTTQDLKSKVRDQVDVSASQAIRDITDASGTLGQILSSNSNCIKAEIKSVIESHLTNLDLESLIQQCNALQRVTVRGESAAVTGVSQALTTELIASIIEQNGVFDDISATEKTLIEQDEVQQNAAIRDLIENLSKTVTGTADLFGSTIVKGILTGAIVAVGAIILYVIWFYLIN
jgi:hypothetical protein